MCTRARACVNLQPSHSRRSSLSVFTNKQVMMLPYERAHTVFKTTMTQSERTYCVSSCSTSQPPSPPLCPHTKEETKIKISNLKAELLAAAMLRESNLRLIRPKKAYLFTIII